MSSTAAHAAAPARPVRSHALRDAATMLRRNLKRARRYPSLTATTVIMPVVMLLLFVYVFGGALGTGIAPVAGSGEAVRYVDYIAPGILLMAVTSGAIATAVAVAVDMTEGTVNRFRTMAISRASVLTGHVVGSLVQTAIGLVAVLGAALACGFRPNATVVEWAAALGVLMLLAFALTWVSAAMGLVAKTVESASNAPMPLTFLPFMGSSIVPPESMPGALRWFAEYQPFTPVNETLRGLLMGTPIGSSGPLALAWSAVLALAGYLWARRKARRAQR
ncbi:ABC transporter permease [Streptomyces solincola]|uniref:Transport permease protein n=1 Tax=Streptomyces solincola TaxID=2100817 RepID=A0A2S9PSK9_9ACTN|nr:ABC transporter permease [Streptomyces solincola]PRH77394.1 ABC transporter permease [Streptomyces solincola]